MSTLLITAALASAAPATVLRHDVDWTLGSGERLTTEVTWEVRIDDPAACVAGLRAPLGLDGASDGGALVMEDLLLVPPTAAAGDVFTLTATSQTQTWQRSGAFATAPDLPVIDARVSVRVPRGTPLTLWHDDDAWVESATATSAELSWTNRAADQPAAMAWSSWEDWLAAGDRLLEVTDDLLGSREGLGRELAGGLAAIDIGTITERVTREIELEPGGEWQTARAATRTVASGRGTAAERGVVLINLLRLAGYEAWPGAYALTGGVPALTVPAPALLQRPLVAVERRGEISWIDPAADNASAPALPASLYGSTAWHARDVPVQVGGTTIADGEVKLVTESRVSRSGDLSWRTDLTARGAARQHLRDLLVPLTVDGRREAIHTLLKVARPQIARLDIDLGGVERPSDELRITVSGMDTERFASVAGGLRGEVPPVLAPALARWLPSNVSIEERVAVSGPPDLTVLTTTELPSEYRASAHVSRVGSFDSRRAVFVTEVLRPYRHSSAALEIAATEFLDEEAAHGPEVWLYPRITSNVVKTVRTTPELPAAEQVTLQALLHLADGDAASAARAVKKASKSVPLRDLVRSLRSTRHTELAELWSLLAELPEQPEDQLALATALHEAGRSRDAWLGAYSVHDAADPALRREALLLMLSNQVDTQPDAAEDPVGHEAWRAPKYIVQWLEEVAPADPRLVRVRALEALDSDAVATAELLLERHLEGGPDAAAEVLLAQAKARAGLPLHEVVERVERAVAEAPLDERIASDAAATLTLVGATERALPHALTAARFGHDDLDLWWSALETALEVGNLPAALYAARRASDIAPESPEASSKLLEMATLAGDEASARLARERGRNFGEAGRDWPVPVEVLLEETGPENVFALLLARDAEVVASATLLERRARLRLAKGLLDGAARDGLLLDRRHGNAAGHAIAFAAIAGRQQSSSSASALYRAAERSKVAALVALELDLVIGARDVEARAAAIDDDRARRIAAALASPGSDPASDWPTELSEPSRAPTGMTPNEALSGAAGVSAWSDPVRRIAVVQVGGITGLLPPPLSTLYTPDPAPLVRLPDGGQVWALRDGALTLYAAQTTRDGQELFVLGFTPGAATRALMQLP